MDGSTDRDRRQALYEAYCTVPEHQRAEIIDGTLYVLPRLAPRLANAKTVLGGALNGAFQRGRGGPGGWWIYEGDARVHAAPFAAIELDLAALWVR